MHDNTIDRVEPMHPSHWLSSELREEFPKQELVVYLDMSTRRLIIALGPQVYAKAEIGTYAKTQVNVTLRVDVMLAKDMP